MKSKEIKELMSAMKQNGIARLKWKRGWNSIVLEQEIIKNEVMSSDTSYNKKNQSISNQEPNGRIEQVTVSKQDISFENIPEKDDNSGNLHLIKSPLIGTYYEASEPEAAPFVKVNDIVNVGDTLCIVEAMKSMNEIKADVSGTIVEIVGENGKLIEYDAVLFKIKV